MADATSAAPAAAPFVPRPSSRALWAGIVAGCAFGFSGWRGLLVPSLIRSIEADFAQTDAGMGTYFLVAAVLYAAGSLLGGAMIRRLGFRWTLGLAGIAISTGLALQGTAETWVIFMLGAVPGGLGAAAIDVGINALILDLFPGSRGRALNLLHLAYSLAALCAPVVVASLVASRVPWQTVVMFTGLGWLAVGAALVLATPSDGRRPDPPRDGSAEPAVTALRAARLPLALVVMAVAIACYVAAEAGISDWLVRFLEDLPVAVASSALTLFWAGIAVGRLGFARVGDRLEPLRAAAAMAFMGAMLLVAAVMAPAPELALILFGVVGIAFGPVYPLVVAAAGARMPVQSAVVSSVLSFAAVVGAVSYPPAVGFLSVTIGLRAAMLGTAVLAAGAAVALVVARRMPAH